MCQTCVMMGRGTYAAADKNAIIHVADACIFAQLNMSPTQEKPLFPTMSDINQIVPATGASKTRLCCFLFVFCSNSETRGNIHVL